MIDNNFMLSILGKTDKKIFSIQFMIAAKIYYKISWWNALMMKLLMQIVSSSCRSLRRFNQKGMFTIFVVFRFNMFQHVNVKRRIKSYVWNQLQRLIFTRRILPNYFSNLIFKDYLSQNFYCVLKWAYMHLNSLVLWFSN